MVRPTDRHGTLRTHHLHPEQPSQSLQQPFLPPPRRWERAASRKATITAASNIMEMAFISNHIYGKNPIHFYGQATRHRNIFISCMLSMALRWAADCGAKGARSQGDGRPIAGRKGTFRNAPAKRPPRRLCPNDQIARPCRFACKHPSNQTTNLLNHQSTKHPIHHPRHGVCYEALPPHHGQGIPAAQFAAYGRNGRHARRI